MMRRAGLALLGALASASPSLAAVCSLTGDTHISPFPGSSYQDLYSPNYYEVLAFNLNDPRRRLEVQANQAYGAWGGNTINNDLAVRCGLDMIVFQQKRNGAVPTMTLNGQVITMAPGTSRLLPSAPADAKDRYYVYFAQSSAWDSIDVDCNVRGNRDDYAYGMKVHMDWYRPFNLGYGGSSSAYVHGNLYVEQQDTYANRNQAGVCGFVPGVNSRNVNHFITYESSLFGKTPRDHANEAKAGRGITDPKALEDARATCARSVFQVTGVTIDKIGEWFKGMDASVQENMKNFIEGCAVDVYFGQGYDSSEVVNQVCSYVSLARDSAYQDIVRQTALIRDCSKEPFVDPATLIPFLEVKFRLYQFCNKAPPKERDPLPKGQGFDPTCAQLKAGAEKITETARAAAAEEAALAAKAEQMKQEAAQEQQAKAIERARMEQETKKIEAERVATAEKENKARADIEKRAADAAAGAAVPLPAVSGLKAGTRMTQKSKVFMMDASKAAFNPLTRRPTGYDGSESS